MPATVSSSEVVLPAVETHLAERLAQARPSATGAVSQAARRLAEQGRQVLDLSAGELDFDTPEHIQQAAIQAIRQGHTRYTDVAGMPQLRAAIMHKFVHDNGLHYDDAQVIAATGAKQILFNALLATLNPGDEVIIVAPYWVSYSEMVRIAGGVPVVLAPDAAHDFKLNASQLAGAITPRTRWLMINSPCNPTGSLYSADEFRALAAVLRDHPRVLVMADDIYEAIVFEGTFTSFAQAAPDMFDRTLTINGVSKTYAMTGWRLGYAGGPKWLIQAMRLLQSQSTSNPCSITQSAAIAALQGPQAFLDEWRLTLRARRDMAARMLDRTTSLLSLHGVPQAAFYLYLNCERALGKRTPQGKVIGSDADMALYLLEDVGVALVPGSAFGLAPYMRLAYTVSDSTLRTACERIVEACNRLVSA